MIPVYISHPTPHTVRQNNFIHDLKDFFLKHDIMCDNIYVSDNSILLQSIRERMKQCFGIVIIAYERKHIDAGMNKRGADMPGVASQRIADVSETTPFTHIEMAMAFAYGLPVIVFKENGLLADGVLDESYREIDKLGFNLDDLSFFDELPQSEAVRSFMEKVRATANRL